jgi:hypothetical protein
MTENLPYSRPTSVGENQRSGLATFISAIGLVGTSVAMSWTVAQMLHRTHDPMFAGPHLIYAWGEWIWTTINPFGSFVRGQHMNALSDYGWRVVGAGLYTASIGIALTVITFLVINRLVFPKSKQDVRAVKDSARMATEVVNRSEAICFKKLVS